MPKEKTSHKPGKIESFFSGVATISGLSGSFNHELLLDDENNPVALVVGFSENFVEALFFDFAFDLNKDVYRSGKLFSINISQKIIGRIVNGLGESIDLFGEIKGEEQTVFSNAPQIIEREPVTEALSTGIKIIDTTLPLGRGQRELIIGDRKLGKSTLATDMVLNQKHAEPPVKCVYVICGQKSQKIEELIDIFNENNAFLYTTVVAASASASLAEIYLAPFVGCAIGEYFRDQGDDVLVIYDDLSKHAKIYRDISLLLERPPGREAYPGDVFSLHAQLLERAAKISASNGGGSLSAVPIVETQEGDITAFISTNLISITDGQIYCERGLYQKGFLPAINVGLSVSRVGSQAQPIPLKQVTNGLRLSLAQHKELQKLAQLETKKSKEAQKKIHRGELLLELLKQDKHTNITWEEQSVLFYVVENGFFDQLPPEKWSYFEKYFVQLLKNRYFELLDSIKNNGFSDDNKEKIRTIVDDFIKEFLS
jgi:F-type H+-transporting ATPase subunit alpha